MFLTCCCKILNLLAFHFDCKSILIYIKITKAYLKMSSVLYSFSSLFVKMTLLLPLCIRRSHIISMDSIQFISLHKKTVALKLKLDFVLVKRQNIFVYPRYSSHSQHNILEIHGWQLHQNIQNEFAEGRWPCHRVSNLVFYTHMPQRQWMLKQNIFVPCSAPSAFVVNVIGGGLYLFFRHLLSYSWAVLRW